MQLQSFVVTWQKGTRTKDIWRAHTRQPPVESRSVEIKKYDETKEKKLLFISDSKIIQI